MTGHDVNQAMEALARGDLANAELLIKRLLDSNPRHAALWQFAGVVACKSGNYEEGVSRFRKALENDPKNEKTKANLAKALYDSGRLEDAESICRESHNLKSVSPQLEHLLGDICKATGRADEAIAIYRRLVSMNPGNFQIWNNLGNQLLEAGRADEAVEASTYAANLRPDLPVLDLNLARALMAAGQSDDSIACIRRGIAVPNLDPELLCGLVNLLNRQRQYSYVIETLGRHSKLVDGNQKLLIEQGYAYAHIEKRAEAESAYRAAIVCDPSNALPYVNLGLLLEQENRLTDLTFLLNSASDCGVPDSHLGLLRARALRREGQMEGALEAALSAEGLVEGTHIVKAQLIGQVCDRLGKYDEAFDSFADMNRMGAAEAAAQNISARAYNAGFSRVSQMTTKRWVNSWAPIELDLSRAAPVFLLSFPRSGTTLLDTMLMGHDSVHIFEEEPHLQLIERMLGDYGRLPDLSALEANRLRAAYFDIADKAMPHTSAMTIIDKLPLHTARVPLIHRLFPDAKFIFALRHPCDVVLSGFMQNFRPNEAMANFYYLDDIARFYSQIMDFWHRCEAFFPLSTCTIRYESMINDPESALRPVVEFIGLPWQPDLLNHQKTAAQRGHVRTASYAQITEPLYSRADGRWRSYRKQMDSVLPILSPWIAEFGYEA